MTDNSVALVEVLPAVYQELTPEQDLFAMAMADARGNIAVAYTMAFGPGIPFPVARGTKLLNLPQVAAKIIEYQVVIRESALIDISGHLIELADIRDLAKSSGQLKTALAAERTRGEVVGLYDNFQKGKAAPAVVVQFQNKFDINI